jgi:class 3 adenylate cyclase
VDGEYHRRLREVLTDAGLLKTLPQPPAICFLDITGYTRLTYERGDEAAADLAERLGRVVTRSTLESGGRPVKWLGDGVMVYFRDPGSGVIAALELVDGVASAGLPPSRWAARRTGALPAGRLLRTNGEPRLADRRVRPAG